MIKLVKEKLLLFSFSIFLNSCNFYGDIDLGSDFYYIVEPAFNSIATPVNPDQPYVSSVDIIRDIEAVGFNKKYILATSKRNDTLSYWIIDKTKESKK